MTIYTYVLAYKLNGRFWSLPMEERANINGNIIDFIKGYKKNLISIKYYKSIRHDNDVLFWAASEEPIKLEKLKEGLNSAFGIYGKTEYSMFSLYEHSPYTNASKSLEDTLKTEPKKYFVAYPMSKDREWYLINYEERKKILAGHIGTARSDKESPGIISYTTYSFGLGDQEFVVLYELDDLSAWSHVTEKLREVMARKWIINEAPIFVGIYNGDELVI
ncbi:MAG: chlorite dismutase family protein [Ferroplasma sp.]|uniref:chlorite dismutase family protein n=1 Tax=Ferroplasma sp. TaxID=2591003 RepID=UPI002815A97E|nr:chlorite dismutase family protein [Ferroplasma sp.]WMT51115.1 MAG: chlorite dismutase family protein [Ferroplasma sp.]